jgi:lysophospholipase L1-like esterase
MKKRIVIYIIVLQLVVIFCILLTLQNSGRSVFGINDLRNYENWRVSEENYDGLIYFYEPHSGRIIEERESGNAIYSINSDSLNSEKEYGITKPSGVYRILVLGDSWTYGRFVSTEKNWPSLLEVKLNELNCAKYKDFEVINLAMYGYDTKYSVHRFKKRGIKYNPDLVLWLHTDLYRFMEEMIPAMNKMYSQGVSQKDAWQKAELDIYNKMGPENILPAQGEYIRELDKYYTGKLAFIISAIIPSEGRAFLENVLNQRGNGFAVNIPLLEKFDAQFPNDYHPNEKGHRIIAETVFDYLFSRGIIKCEDSG